MEYTVSGDVRYLSFLQRGARSLFVCELALLGETGPQGTSSVQAGVRSRTGAREGTHGEAKVHGSLLFPVWVAAPFLDSCWWQTQRLLPAEARAHTLSPVA